MDGLFSFAEAWNQFGFMLGALILTGLGGAMIGDWIYKRKKGARCQATIVGVREKESKNSSIYYPVVEYFSKETGDTVRAETDVGSSSLAGKEPGTKVTILAMPGKPENVTIDGKLTLIIGIIMLLPGLGLGYHAITGYSFSIWTILLPLGVGIFLAAKILPKVRKAGGFGQAPTSKYALNDSDGGMADQAGDSVSAGAEKPSIAGLKDIGSALLAGAEQKQSKTKYKGEMLDEAGFARKKKETAKQMRKAGPFIMLVGLIFLGIGIWLTQDLLHMLQVGQRTEGEVVRLEESYSSSSSGGSSYTYYPIVEFTVPDTGQRVEFKDSVGSNPPSYHSGEDVTVLYDPAHPDTESMIDRGIWNWLAPGLCTLIGGLVFLFSLKNWISARREAERF